MNKQETVYTEENLPEDFEVFTGKSTKVEYTPIEENVYQFEIYKISLKNNRYYELDPDKNSKYVFEFEFVIVDECKYYGRRLWDKVYPSLKPEGKQGPPRLYKIVTKAMKKELDWEGCAKFAEGGATFMENLNKYVLGKQIKIAVVNNTGKDEKVWSNIGTYMNADKKLPAFDPEKVTAITSKFENETKSEDVDPEDIPF